METVVDILKISGIDIIDTNISKNVEIVQGKPRTSLGPFLPISSGDYNIISIETKDFESFEVTATY